MPDKRPESLIIDSRQRGSGTIEAFRLQLNPAIAAAAKVCLLFASVPNPPTGVEPYYIVRIPELGNHVRSADETSAGCWVIPVTSAQGFRTFHRAEGDFDERALQQPSGTISQLSVSIHNGDGSLADLGGFEWHLVLGISY